MISESRISKLKEYLTGVIDELTNQTNSVINADFLGDTGDYSLDKIPTEISDEKWIVGTAINKDVYSFRSRKDYSADEINNLNNIGFFEAFEQKIKSNNEEGELPDIDGIQSIECLNSGTLASVDGNRAVFDIQIRITYIENKNKKISL